MGLMRHLNAEIDHEQGELRLLIDMLFVTKDERAIAQSLAQACVGPGKSIECIEEDGMIFSKIRVKIHPDSILGKQLAASG